MLLHDYWRSGAGYRVRIGLHLKGLRFDRHPIDLRAGAQGADGYRALNAQKLVPTLEMGGLVLTQSVAILEWLDETYPDPPLLPAGPADRAIVRAMAATIACDIHPLGNLRVLNYLRGDLDAGKDKVLAWAAHWIGEGFAALETMIARHGEGFAFGDRPTLADCCLVPQLASAERFGVDVTPYPALVAAAERARALDAFQKAHPSSQSDADPG